MSITAYVKGQASVSTYWHAYNNTTGAKRTDIVYNTASLTMQYVRNRAAAVSAVTGGGTAPVTLAADTTAHTAWGFRHVGGGLYRADWPDAAFLTGVDFVVLDIYGPTDTVFAPAPGPIDLTGADPRSATVDVGTLAANSVTASALATDAVTEIVSAIFARTYDATKMSGLTFEELTALIGCAVLAKASGMDTTSAVIRNLGDTANAIAATVDANGNRTAVTRTLTSVR